MGVLFGNLIMGAIAGVLAHNKARNALGWFVAGCLVGPFALVVALLPMVHKQGVTQVCANCAEIVQARAQICRYCRSNLRGLSSA